MIDRSHRHRFVAQALARGGVGGRFRRQQLDRDLTIEGGVVGTVDLAHAARADGRENLVAAETRARCERQGGNARILARIVQGICLTYDFSEL